MQNVRKFLIMIAIAFFIAVIVSCVLFFSVNKVSAEFSVYGNDQTQEIKSELDKFKGKSYLFVKESDLYSVLQDYPYYAFSSIKKEFPNVISVKIYKRVETFRVVVGDKMFTIDEDGIVLNETGATETSNVITVNLSGISVNSSNAGEKIATTNDNLFYSVVQTVKEVKLKDIVKDITVLSGVEKHDVEFSTFTGVKITVVDADENGEEKVQKAFELYESLNDYEKTSSEIQAYSLTSGAIRVVWVNPEN